jgi:multidrug efflux pump subunit AcrA (membrane-fusion protein)
LSLAEFVNRGALLLKADRIGDVDISAQFTMGKMRPLRAFKNNNNTQKNSILTAQISLQTTDKIMHWNGTVQGSTGIIDLQTQSQSIIVNVKNPYQQATPGSRPPLVRNTFVKVTLFAPVLENKILLPITAIHEDHIYIVDKNSKLKIIPIKVDFIQQEVAVIKSGLKQGDIVVLSPLFPAIKGMTLKAQADKKMIKWLEKKSLKGTDL